MRVGPPNMLYLWTNLTYGKYLWSIYGIKLVGERELNLVSGTRSMRRRQNVVREKWPIRMP